MNDNDIQTVYQSALPVSHAAGLRAVYDAGWQQALNQSVTASTVDASLSQTVPTTDVTITTP